jgi:hypothetical protein
MCHIQYTVDPYIYTKINILYYLYLAVRPPLCIISNSALFMKKRGRGLPDGEEPLLFSMTNHIHTRV